jgi:hypothetical protein
MLQLKAEKRKLVRAHQELIASRGKPNHLAQCRFTDGDLQSVCDLYQSPAYQSLRIESVADAFGEAPRPPSAAEQQVIEEVEDESFVGPLVSPPWWCRSICRVREAFTCAAIAGSEDSDVYWLLLFAKKSPRETTWLQLRRRPLVLDLTEDRGEGLDRVVHGVNRRGYDWYPPVVKTEADLPLPRDDCELFVREGCRFHGEIIAAPHAAVPLELVLAQAPRPTKETVEREKKKRTTASEREDVLKQYPWLSSEDLPGGPKSKRRSAAERHSRKRTSGAVSSDDGTASDQEEGDLGVDAAVAASGDEGGDPMHELAVIRDELAWDEEEPYFYIHVMGGRWTRLNRGVPANSIGGKARRGVIPWCDLYSFSKQCSHAFGLYGREESTFLSREFCRRGNFFYQFYDDAPGDEYAYTSDVVNSYVETEEWLDFVCGLDIESPAFAAGVAVRAMVPVIGPP